MIDVIEVRHVGDPAEVDFPSLVEFVLMNLDEPKLCWIVMTLRRGEVLKLGGVEDPGLEITRL